MHPIQFLMILLQLPYRQRILRLNLSQSIAAKSLHMRYKYTRNRKNTLHATRIRSHHKVTTPVQVAYINAFLVLELEFFSFIVSRIRIHIGPAIITRFGAHLSCFHFFHDAIAIVGVTFNFFMTIPSLPFAFIAKPVAILFTSIFDGEDPTLSVSTAYSTSRGTVFLI